MAFTPPRNTEVITLSFESIKQLEQALKPHFTDDLIQKFIKTKEVQNALSCYRNLGTPPIKLELAVPEPPGKWDKWESFLGGKNSKLEPKTRQDHNKQNANFQWHLDKSERDARDNFRNDLVNEAGKFRLTSNFNTKIDKLVKNNREKVTKTRESLQQKMSIMHQAITHKELHNPALLINNPKFKEKISELEEKLKKKREEIDQELADITKRDVYLFKTALKSAVKGNAYTDNIFSEFEDKLEASDKLEIALLKFEDDFDKGFGELEEIIAQANQKPLAQAPISPSPKPPEPIASKPIAPAPSVLEPKAASVKPQTPPQSGEKLFFTDPQELAEFRRKLGAKPSIPKSQQPPKKDHAQPPSPAEQETQVIPNFIDQKKLAEIEAVQYKLQSGITEKKIEKVRGLLKEYYTNNTIPESAQNAYQDAYIKRELKYVADMGKALRNVKSEYLPPNFVETITAFDKSVKLCTTELAKAMTQEERSHLRNDVLRDVIIRFNKDLVEIEAVGIPIPEIKKEPIDMEAIKRNALSLEERAAKLQASKAEVSQSGGAVPPRQSAQEAEKPTAAPTASTTQFETAKTKTTATPVKPQSPAVTPRPEEEDQGPSHKKPQKPKT